MCHCISSAAKSLHIKLQILCIAVLLLLLIIILTVNARLITVVCRNILIICEGGLVFSCTSDETVIFQNRITRSKGIFTSGMF